MVVIIELLKLGEVSLPIGPTFKVITHSSNPPPLHMLQNLQLIQENQTNLY